MATGYFGDRLVIYLARKNGGYKEPEMRLWTLGFCFIYTAVGYLTYGWVAQAGEHVSAFLSPTKCYFECSTRKANTTI